MTKIIYYTTKNGNIPAKKFLNSLEKRDKVKIFRIFQYIQNYGLLSVLPHVKKLAGTPLWEIRILGRNSIRIIYASTTKESILILHGFLKKTQKTPDNEIILALKRLTDHKSSY